MRRGTILPCGPRVARGRLPPTRKGTILRYEARDHPDGTSFDVPARRRLAFSPAADVIGSELDLHLTGSHVVHALTPGFCYAAAVYLLERWLLEENAPSMADPSRIEARRLALRVGTAAPEDWDVSLPVGEVVVFPRETPYVRACTTRQSQLLDGADPHTTQRLVASTGEDSDMRDVLKAASFLVVPLHLRGVAVGFIACVRPPDRAPFVPGDAVAVESLAARACVALDNARRYQRERRTALAIRSSLLPVTGQAFEGCRIVHGYVPAGQDNIIGGDWFDVLPRPGGRVGLVVGDAMGHGPESAVAMIQLRTAARSLAGIDLPPAEIVRRLDALASETPGASFATCMYAEWDPKESTCTFVGAGHPPPLIRGPGGRAAPVTLTSAGLPLGLGTGTYEPTVVHVPEPALLLLYSDGLVESRHTDIDQGIARLAGLLGTDAGSSAHPAGTDTLQALCQRLLHDTSATVGTDDRTLLLAALTPGQD